MPTMFGFACIYHGDSPTTKRTKSFMSSTNSVAFQFATTHESNDAYRGINYTIYFVNNTSTSQSTTGETFTYDVSSITSGLISGSLTGSVPPGQTQSVSFQNGSTDAECSVSNFSIQNGAAPLLTIGDLGTVCFWFFTNGGNNATQQQIAICGTGNGTTLPISTFLSNTSSQQEAYSSSTGLNVTLDGGGNDLTTTNIYIQVGTGE